MSFGMEIDDYQDDLYVSRHQKLAIIIINRETPEMTGDLVKHIKTFFNPENYSLTVVDNSVWYPMEEADVHNGYNRGFDQVVIDWLKINRGNYLGYWVLNSDCILKEKDYTETIIEYLQKDPGIGLLSTTIDEIKRSTQYYDNEPGDNSLLQHPQNMTDTKHALEIGYIDLQSAIISNNLLMNFKMDKHLVYFLGGLDLDLNICADRHTLKKVLIPELNLFHKGGQSYVNRDGTFNETTHDSIVWNDTQKFIRSLGDITEDDGRPIEDNTRLMAYGLRKRYGINLFDIRNELLNRAPVAYER